MILTLIQKITEKIGVMGLKSPEPAFQRHVEKPKPIQKLLDLVPLIEHTLLKPESTHRDIQRLCDEAKQFRFHGVCVNPVFVKEAQQQLAGTDCLVITVG